MEQQTSLICKPEPCCPLASVEVRACRRFVFSPFSVRPKSAFSLLLCQPHAPTMSTRWCARSAVCVFARVCSNVCVRTCAFERVCVLQASTSFLGTHFHIADGQCDDQTHGHRKSSIAIATSASTAQPAACQTKQTEAQLLAHVHPADLPTQNDVLAHQKQISVPVDDSTWVGKVKTFWAYCGPTWLISIAYIGALLLRLLVRRDRVSLTLWLCFHAIFVVCSRPRRRSS